LPRRARPFPNANGEMQEMTPPTPNPPCFVILAGPNGAGKSTVAPRLLRDLIHLDNFLNADVVARGLSDWSAESHAFTAGKIVLRQTQEFLQQRESFAIETTLAAKTYGKIAQQAADLGYRTILLYLWIASSRLSVSRVAGRVAEGGHHIPRETILRRYETGLRNLFRLYMPLVDEWYLINNSLPGQAYRSIAESIDGNLTIYDPVSWKKLEDYHGRHYPEA